MNLKSLVFRFLTRFLLPIAIIAGAVYGFMQFLLQFLRRVKPNRIAVALDESLFSGFRHGLCPNYKSNRELPDENLAMQLNG